MLQAAGLLFFAFAGYARIATLGEEVRDPARTIPRAVPLALGVVLAVYLVGRGGRGRACSARTRLAASAAPLADVVTGGRAARAGPGGPGRGRGGGAGVAARPARRGVAGRRWRWPAAGDVPGALAAVHPRPQVPHRAELAVAAVVVAVVALGDVRGAIGFSSCAVLVYYAITNAAALTLGRDPARRLPVRALAALGLVGCLLLAVNLPTASVLAGFGVLALGALWYALRPGR